MGRIRKTQPFIQNALFLMMIFFAVFLRISKDLRSVVYCTVLRHGSEKEWTFLWNQYVNSNVATEKNTILGSLGCTREIWLLKRYLEWSISDNSGIRRQDSSTVFSNVARNDLGYFLAKDFFYENIDKVVSQ